MSILKHKGFQNALRILLPCDRTPPFAPRKPCGQLLYQPVGKTIRTAGINRAVDIHHAYPQEEHKLAGAPLTICPPGFRSPEHWLAQAWRRLSTENPLPIKIYINYLLKFFLFVLSCIVIYLLGDRIQIDLAVLLL